MKPIQSNPCFFGAALLALIVFNGGAWATTELDIDADLLSASKTTSTPVAAKAVFSPVVQTPIPTVKEVLDSSAAPPSLIQATPTVEEGSIVITPTPGQGVLQMREVYKVGLTYYQKQDFAKAIRYLKKSLDIHDPYTSKFYYAEANAMLGVIYQFHIIDRSLAYHYYRAALDIDPSTATAKKHIDEVADGQMK